MAGGTAAAVALALILGPAGAAVRSAAERPAAHCLIVAVSDGDTLTARCGEAGAFRQVKVRLAEIDAPEKRQPFGQRSRANLTALCFGRFASFTTVTKDRYGRSVARVECNGLDANAEQVRGGMAWVYTRYQTDPSLTRLETDARANRAGLWADEAPLAPWRWRQRSRDR